MADGKGRYTVTGMYLLEDGKKIKHMERENTSTYI